jgi:ATP-dependent Clp protease ATP-binding subunit ClpC
MLERFTPRGRQAVAFATDEARALGHDAVGTEHLLLGLLRDEGAVAAQALDALGVTLDEARSTVVAIDGRGDLPTTGELALRPETKRVLEGALREAFNIDQQLIDTQHILIALTREPNGVAGQILAQHNLNDRLVRGVVAKLVVASRPRASRWEYRIVDLSEAGELSVDLLSGMDAEGWELVTVTAGRAVFKRRA